MRAAGCARVRISAACRVSALRSSARCCASCACEERKGAVRVAVMGGAAMVGAVTPAEVEVEVAARAVVMAVVAH